MSAQGMELQAKMATPGFNASDLWENEDLSDTVFIVGTEANNWRFVAHKLILMQCSPILKMMLNGMTNESQQVIRIKDIRPEVFNLLLKCIYLGPKHEYMGSMEDAVDLNYAAHLYVIDNVITTSISYLCERINANNFGDYGCLIRVYQNLEPYLGEKKYAQLHFCFAKAIDHQADSVFKSDACQYLTLRTMDIFTRRGNLNISSEQVIYDAVLEWSAIECKRRSLIINDENRRKCLKKLLSNICFHELSNETIFDGKRLGYITDQNVLDNIHKTRLKPTAFVFNRFQDKSCEWKDSDLTDHCISFIIDKSAYLSEVLLCGICSPVEDEDQKEKEQFNYCFDQNFIFQLRRRKEILSQIMSKEKWPSEHPDSFLLQLEQPILLQGGIQYTLFAHVNAKNTLSLQSAVESSQSWTDGMTTWNIQWEECDLPVKNERNGTKMDCGQLFELALYPPLHPSDVDVSQSDSESFDEDVEVPNKKAKLDVAVQAPE